ncbi:MAG: YfcE family phosphodiesterase [Defluviitaleaceae bacterium]|nr:YfcE family phosphodiesterase [Defluviitaleaceae bacterium]
MKIAVFSDSHKKTYGIDKALDKIIAYVGCIIHLGDGYDDVDEYKYIYSNINFYNVLGNCDVDNIGREEHVFEIANKRIFITHGHLYSVKSGYSKIISAAKEKSVDICLFGHTHKADIFYDSEILFMNPGSITYKGTNGRRSFGVIDITDENAVAGIVTLKL